MCVYASRACACVLVYMCALQRAGTCVHPDVDSACVVCRVRLSCAVQKRLKVMHACILLQHSASLFIQLRTPMIHPCSPWVATSAHAKFAGVGHVGLGAKDPTADAPKGSGTTAGGARTTHARGGLRPEEDRGAHLLALRPLLTSSINSSLPHPPVRNRFWWERLAQRLRLEAYPLPARSDRCAPDCVGGGKATLGVRVCGRGANERIQERAERQASTNQTRSAAGMGSVHRPQEPPA